MTLLLSEREVRDLTRISELVDVIREGYEVEADGDVTLPARVNLDSSSGFFRLMPGVIPGCGVMGFKVFNQLASHGVQYLIGLLDERDGELLALVNGAYLTAARTGATTGVAASCLASPGIADVGLIGSGLEAETNLEGVCAVLPLERVCVYSPNAERRAAFAQRMSARLDLDVVAVDSPEEAATQPVVIVATNTGHGTGRIALHGEWLRPGAVVLSIGSTVAALREIDTEVIRRAALVVADAPEQAAEESGDMIAADREGLLDRRVVSLATLVSGAAPAVPPEGISVFKSVGTALQDLLAAKAVYDRATLEGVGVQVDLLTSWKPAGT